MKKFTSKLRRAFTITELVIVIAVIAILAAVLIPTFSYVISSARESAAMQECHNALLDYSGQVADEGGSAESGMVFVNNGYAYVYLNSGLHLVGELDDLVTIQGDGNIKGKATELKGVKGLTESLGASFTVQVGEGEAKTVSLAKVEKPTVTSAAHLAENMYVYNIEVNDTQYAGFFTVEQLTGADKEGSFQIQETLYSRQFGFVATSGTTTGEITFAKA